VTNESPPSPSVAGLKPIWAWAAVVLLLLIHAALAIDTMRRKSVTVDEVGHLPAGISYLQQGTFELYHHNPPLVKLLAALPALATQPTVDYTKSWTNRGRNMPLSPWAFGWEFMYSNAARYHAIYFWARLPIVALSLVAGLTIFLWARELFGPASGLVALALWTFCPNAIAHAGLVTTDMGGTSLGFVATYFFWRYLRQPTWPRAGVAGLLLGLAQLAKFSSLLLYFIWPVVWLAWIAAHRRPVRGSRGVGWAGSSSPTTLSGKTLVGLEDLTHSTPFLGKALLAGSQFLVILLLSVFVINFGYLFEGTGTRLKQFAFLSQSLTRPRPPGAPRPVLPPDHPWHDVLAARQNRFAGSWLGNLPVPLPKHYVEGFDEQKLESEGVGGSGYPVYLCGELRRTGWWWYYLFALSIKTPIGTGVLMLLVIGGLARRKLSWASLVDELALLVPIATVLVVMSFLTDINLGLRYVLPIFPYWFVRVSRVALVIDLKKFGLPLIALAALAWNVVACARIHPDHLAYFNEFVGGPKNGGRYLIDSNLDWGQDLLALEEWLREHRPGERVGLAYFGNVDPSILAASGRPIDFYLAPPWHLDALRLLSTRPDGPIAAKRNEWIESHLDELRYWMEIRQKKGKPARPNDHPEIRQPIFRSLGCQDGPRPGLFAVSMNLHRGLPFRVRDQAGGIWNAEERAFQYFGFFTPIGRAGNSILIYDISFGEANRVREMLELAPLDPRTGEPNPALSRWQDH